MYAVLHYDWFRRLSLFEWLLVVTCHLPSLSVCRCEGVALWSWPTCWVARLQATNFRILSASNQLMRPEFYLSSGMTTMSDLTENQIFLFVHLFLSSLSLLDKIGTGASYAVDACVRASVFNCCCPFLGIQKGSHFVLILPLRGPIYFVVYSKSDVDSRVQLLIVSLRFTFCQVWHKMEMNNKSYAVFLLGCMQVCKHGPLQYSRRELSVV